MPGTGSAHGSRHGRNSGIRTRDPLVPNEVRCQAAPCSVGASGILHGVPAGGDGCLMIRGGGRTRTCVVPLAVGVLQTLAVAAGPRHQIVLRHARSPRPAMEEKCRHPGSNGGPSSFQLDALPTEL